MSSGFSVNWASAVVLVAAVALGSVMSGCASREPTVWEAAQRHFAEGRWDEAVALLDRLIATDGDKPEYRLLRGRANLGKQQYERAVRDFTAAIAERPDDPEPYHHRAIAHRLMGNDEQSFADSRTARELDVRYKTAYAFEPDQPTAADMAELFRADPVPGHGIEGAESRGNSSGRGTASPPLATPPEVPGSPSQLSTPQTAGPAQIPGVPPVRPAAPWHEGRREQLGQSTYEGGPESQTLLDRWLTDLRRQGEPPEQDGRPTSLATANPRAGEPGGRPLPKTVTGESAATGTSWTGPARQPWSYSPPVGTTGLLSPAVTDLPSAVPSPDLLRGGFSYRPGSGLPWMEPTVPSPVGGLPWPRSSPGSVSGSVDPPTGPSRLRTPPTPAGQATYFAPFIPANPPQTGIDSRGGTR